MEPGELEASAAHELSAGPSYLHPGARGLAQRRANALRRHASASFTAIATSVVSPVSPIVSPIVLDETAAGDTSGKAGEGEDAVGEGEGEGGDGGTLSGMAYSLLEPFLLANGYGLFRDMTGVGPSVLDSHGRVVAQVT